MIIRLFCSLLLFSLVFSVGITTENIQIVPATNNIGSLIESTPFLEFVEAEWMPPNTIEISTEDLRQIGGANARVDHYIVKDSYGYIERDSLIILKNTVMNESDLKSAVMGTDEYGKPFVSIEFNGKGTDKLAEVTGRNIAKPLAILLDGRIISAPTVREPVLEGKGEIHGSFTLLEAQDIAKRINQYAEGKNTR